MAVRKKWSPAQAFTTTINGRVFRIVKGDGPNARWYVQNENGTYLTSGRQGRTDPSYAYRDAADIERADREKA